MVISYNDPLILGGVFAEENLLSDGTGVIQ